MRKLEGRAGGGLPQHGGHDSKPDAWTRQSLEVLRDGKSVELQITLMPRPGIGSTGAQQGHRQAQIRSTKAAAKDGGAEIGFVRAGSPAELAGVGSGEILLKLDDIAISDQKGLDAAVNGHKVGDRVTLTLRRGGKDVQLEVELAEQDAPPPPPGGGRPNVKGPIVGPVLHFQQGDSARAGWFCPDNRAARFMTWTEM